MFDLDPDDEERSIRFVSVCAVLGGLTGAGFGVSMAVSHGASIGSAFGTAIWAVPALTVVGGLAGAFTGSTVHWALFVLGEVLVKAPLAFR